MAVTDFASQAAATTAGYAFTAVDRGASSNPRFLARFEKPTTGDTANSGQLFKAEGDSNVDQPTATAKALSALNAQRRHYYAGAPGRASGSTESTSGRGGTHTTDTT